MGETSILPNNIGANRRPDGTFGPGNIANPEGKPKGAFSITALVKAELQKCPPGEDQKTYARQFIEKLFQKAITDGDVNLIKTVWAYMDGLPKETKEHKGEITVIVNNDGNKYSLPVSNTVISEGFLDDTETKEGDSLAS